MPNRFLARWLYSTTLILSVGAESKGQTARGPVVVYSALDREFAEPILKAYASRTGAQVRPKFDIESTKTVGLTNLLVAEAARPRCDVFWNNEILNTLRLRRKGLLAPFVPSRAADLPES
ncbi:extracellular solute-binding protein, partial [Singulisphaera rosea]